MKLPNVAELAEEFGVARETLRQALGVLESDGLIDRTRGRGTFVRKTPGMASTQNLSIDWDSLSVAHEGVEIQLLDEGVVDELPQRFNDGNSSGRYRTMRRLHSRDGVPYLVSSFYLSEDVFKKVPAGRFLKESSLPILRDVLQEDIGSAHQVLTIGSADVETASLLNVPINAPVAQVTRLVGDKSGRCVYAGYGIYRGDSVRLEIALR